MIISQSPLRISLFGGGTDLKKYYERYEGAVVSFTIDKYVYVVVKPNLFDDTIILNYYEKERVDRVDQIKNGIIREALKLAGIKRKIDITVLYDVPVQGTGLGSSSAFAVGLLNALFAYQGIIKTPEELAEMASHIEIDLLGDPIGKQDQYASAFGGLSNYTFCKNGKVIVNPLDVSKEKKESLASHILLFHTGLERKSSDILTDQKEKMDDHLDYFHGLKEIAQNCKESLKTLDIAKLGELLNQSWAKKKKLSQKIQNEVIETMYETGINAGALGGKILGAGGGGFLCFLCPLEKRDDVKHALAGFKELPFSMTHEGSHVRFL